MSDDYVMAPSATLASAQRASAASLVKAESLSVDVCIAVADGAGHLLAMARMGRAPLMCIQIAQDKGVLGRRLRGNADRRLVAPARPGRADCGGGAAAVG